MPTNQTRRRNQNHMRRFPPAATARLASPAAVWRMPERESCPSRDPAGFARWARWRRGVRLRRFVNRGMSAAAIALQPLQFGVEIGSVLVAQRAVFFQRARDDRFELRRNVGIQARRRGSFAIQDRFEDQPGRISAKRQSARGHFIQHHAERKKIGARVERLAAHLLGRHVRNRADGAPRAGHHLFRRSVGCRRGGDAGIFR